MGEGMEIQQWLQSLLDSMTCSGTAVTYTYINRFTRHNFIVAMGIFSLLPTNPLALPPWSGIPLEVCLPVKGWWPCQGRGKREGQQQIHGVGGVSTCPKCLPLRPWTCSLRTGRGKASPVERILLGGHAQSALPSGHPQVRRNRRRHGEWNKYSHPSTTMWVSKPKDTSALTFTKMFN